MLNNDAIPKSDFFAPRRQEIFFFISALREIVLKAFRNGNNYGFPEFDKKNQIRKDFKFIFVESDSKLFVYY